ncbi:MAG: hypothetical protein U0175_28455 [Caldilineaceae bacterium]
MLPQRIVVLDIVILLMGLLFVWNELSPPLYAASTDSPATQPAEPSQKMILNTGYQLWLADAKGENLEQVATESDEILRVLLSPDNEHVAYVVDRDTKERFRGLELRLLSLTNHTAQTITPLQPTKPVGTLSEGEHADAEHATRAVLEENRDGIVWSPSGSKLAFVSEHERSKAQLYVYDLAKGKLTRLSDEASHAYQFVWSPDERWIFHTGTSHFSGNEPYQDPVGVWVSRTDGSEQRALYSVAAESSDERLVAWLDRETVLVYSATMKCGNSKLRTINIKTGKSVLITNRSFSTVALDAESGVALVHVEPELRCNPANFVGTYLWKPGQRVLRQISKKELPWPSDQPWHPGWHLVGEDHIDWMSPTGELLPGDPTPPFCLLDFGRNGYAWTVTLATKGVIGTWVKPYGGSPERIADRAHILQWSADGAVLYFVDQNGTDLYAAAAPSYQPHLLGQTPPVRTLHQAGSPAAYPGCG